MLIFLILLYIEYQIFKHNLKQIIKNKKEYKDLKTYNPHKMNNKILLNK